MSAPSTSEPSVPRYPDASDVKLPGWRPETVLRAARSLLKYIGERKMAAKDLFDEDDEMLYLQIALKRIPMGKQKLKPVRLPIPTPLHTPETTEICLFVKDMDGEGHKAAKRRVALMDKHAGVSKVIGVSKLRKKYESFEAKRALCKAYDLFLADDRVIPSLPKLIGKDFFKKKKQPVPVDLTRKDWGNQVRSACEATYMFQSTGTSINIRVARSAFSPEQIAANVHAALAAAVQRVPKRWTNVRGVFLKTAESVALPLFQALPDEVLRIGSSEAEGDAAGAAEGEQVPGSSAQPAPAKAAAGKAKGSRVKPATAAKASSVGKKASPSSKAAPKGAAAAVGVPSAARSLKAGKTIKKAGRK